MLVLCQKLNNFSVTCFLVTCIRQSATACSPNLPPPALPLKIILVLSYFLTAISNIQPENLIKFWYWKNSIDKDSYSCSQRGVMKKKMNKVNPWKYKILKPREGFYSAVKYLWTSLKTICFNQIKMSRKFGLEFEVEHPTILEPTRQ